MGIGKLNSKQEEPEWVKIHFIKEEVINYDSI